MNAKTESASPLGANYGGRIVDYRNVIFLITILISAVIYTMVGIVQKVTGYSVTGAHLIGDDAWQVFLERIACEGWYVSFGWTAYQWFSILDFVLIIFYSLTLYCLYFIIKHNLATYDQPESKRKRLLQSLLYTSVGLIFIDVIETSGLLFFENNIPWVSSIKFILIFVIAFILVFHFIGRQYKLISLVARTVYYCRFSVLGVVLVIIFLLIPQGREMMIYMLETTNRIFYIVGFNICILFAGLAYWYFPRFLFPENPRDGYKWFTTPIDYFAWNLHYLINPEHGKAGQSTNQNISTRRTRDLNLAKEYVEGSGDRLRLSDLGERRMVQMYGIKGLLTNQLSPQQLIVKLRTWIPLIISLVFFAFLFCFFLGLTLDLSNANVLKPVSDGYSGQIRNMIGFILILGFGVAYRRLLSNGWQNMNARMGWRLWFSLSSAGLILIIVGFMRETPNMCLALIGQLILVFEGAHCVYLVARYSRRIVRIRDNYQIFHRGLLIVLAVAVIFLVIYLIAGPINTVHSIGLIAIILISLFYYFLYLVFAYKGNDDKRRSNYLTGLLILLFIANFIASKMDNNHFDVETHELTKEQQIAEKGISSLDEYVNNFRSRLLATWKSRNGKIPVYFIAANGGGTTQAHWVASVLAKLKQATNDKFSQHVFAMSGASGGAVGLGVSVLAWNQPPDQFSKSIDSIYNHDYLTGGVVYMLTSDTWLAALPVNLKGVINRNSWLQANYRKKLKLVLGHDGWNQPFRNQWMGGNKLKPLYYANTTRAEDGERTFVGPYAMSDSATTGLDLLVSMSNLRRPKTLPFGSAVMLTNRFPYVNSSGKIDKIGHFVDGGYHDNSGMQTLIEVKTMVENKLFGDSLFAPVFLHFNFGNMWNEYGLWNSCDTCPIPNGLAEINESSVPGMTAYGSILSASVANRIEHLIDEGMAVHRLYLPDPSLLVNSPSSCKKDSILSVLNFEQIKFNWINNPLGRTITRNQQKYVKEIINSPTIQPGKSIYDVIHEVRDQYAKDSIK